MKSLNTLWQTFKLTESDRSRIKDHNTLCLGLTGLSGSEKSTLANALEFKLKARGRHTYILDGDNLS